MIDSDGGWCNAYTHTHTNTHTRHGVMAGLVNNSPKHRGALDRLPFQGFARHSGIQVFRLYSRPSPVTDRNWRHFARWPRGRAWHCMIAQGAHGIACREVAQRSMQFDSYVARSNVECPIGPTADAWDIRISRVTTAWDVLSAGGRVSVGCRAHAWVVRWVVGALSVNRRRERECVVYWYSI
jgi:hypothetical protein